MRREMWKEREIRDMNSRCMLRVSCLNIVYTHTHTNIPSIHTNTRIINFGYMLISINDSVKDKQFIAFIIFWMTTAKYM
jgi:hypothetical protein